MALLTNINGKFSVSDAGAVTFNDAFTFPTADGTANYVLKTNGSGQLAWAADNDTDYDYWILQGDSSANININSTNILKFVGGTYMDANATWAGGSYPRKLTINHENTSRSDTTSTDAPAFGGTFEAVTSVTTNATGHVTAIDVSTVTIPNENGDITGSGTANTVTKFTGAKVIGDGPITFSGNNSIFAENVGIGITPSASFSGVEVLQLGKGMTLMGNTNDDRAAMMANLYLDSNTAFRYVMDGLAGKVAIEDGIITFGTAPSGIAGEVATVTERMRIDSSGLTTIKRTGITGVAKADMILQIGYEGNNGQNNLIGFGYNGGTNIPAYIGYTTTSGGGSTQGDLVFATRGVTTDTAPTERMRISASGNVGIGQAPSDFADWRVLELKGLTNGSMLNFENSSSVRTGAIVMNDASSLLRLQTMTASGIAFEPNNAEAMRIDSSGNVGIGGSPTNKFSIKDGSNANFEAGCNSDSIFIQSYNRTTSAWADIVFNTNGETMRIDSSGNVKVGRSAGYGNSRIQSFIDSTANFATPAYLAADSTNMAQGVGGEISFIGKYATGVDDYAFYGGIKGFKENATSGNTACALGFYTRPTGTLPSERMRIDSSGNVGIGNEGTSIVVTGKGLGIQNIGQDTTASMRLTGHNATGNPGVATYTELKHYGEHLRFGINHNGGTDAITINSSKNVGIGTTSPNQDGFGASTKVLSLKGNSSGGEAVLELIGLGNADNDQVGIVNFMSQAATSPLAAIKGLRHTSDESGKLTFLTAGSERMRIDATGKVGIGLTGPTAKLHVFEPTANTGVTLKVQSYSWDATLSLINDQSTWEIVNDQTGLGTNGTLAFYNGGYRMALTPAGNLGIGVTNPTYKLHVASSNNVSIFEDTSNASGAAFIVFNRPSVFSMGSITRNGSANSVSYNTGSDYRLKEDLKDFNALDLVNNITAYDYKWKDVEQRDYGFIAHELKQTLPNVVTGEKDGEKMQGVDYSKLTPILLKAIQEQQEIINDLKSRIEQLEN